MTLSRGLGVKVAVVAGVVAGSIFAGVGGFSHGYTWKNISLLFSSGFFIGVVAGPEIEPKAFRFPTLWQIIACALGFSIGAIFFRAPPEGIALAALIGVVLGYLAPYWLKHVQGP